MGLRIRMNGIELSSIGIELSWIRKNRLKLDWTVSIGVWNSIEMAFFGTK
jgi:hypothetical protein